jgi:hypothetical protein
MRSTTAALAFQRVRILARIAGTKKKRWNSSLAPKSSSRCLSSARPLTLEEDITESEWQEKAKYLKKVSSQSPPPTAPTGPPNAEFSTTSPAEVTDLTDNDSHEYVSTNTLTYTGGASMPVTSKLHIVTPQEDTPSGIWPVFRLMVRSHFMLQFLFFGFTFLSKSRVVVTG